MMAPFPKHGEFLLRDDPLMVLRKALQLHGFEGNKRYFWSVIAIVKVVLLFDRIAFVFTCLNRPRRVAELSASLPVAVTGMLKMLYLYFDKERMGYLYDAVTSQFWDYRICGPKLEKRVTDLFKFTNRILCAHTMLSSFIVLLFLVFPVADMPSKDDRMLPNVVWTPIDLNPSPVYEIAFSILLINGVMTYIGNIVYDFFYLYCVQHLTVQFLILGELLRNITDGIMENASDVEKFNSKYFQKTVMERLKTCAEHHCKLLKYGKNIESFCSIMLVPQLVLTYATLVVNGFILSIDRSDFSQTVILFNLSVSIFMQLVLFAIPSSQLNAISLTVLDALYDSKWYLFNASMKKACTFIMMNGQKGISITAGGVTNIDNPLLVEMLQKVFSAITLLTALIDGNTTE